MGAPTTNNKGDPSVVQSPALTNQKETQLDIDFYSPVQSPASLGLQIGQH
jgi:hypothetical protein